MQPYPAGYHALNVTGYIAVCKAFLRIFHGFQTSPLAGINGRFIVFSPATLQLAICFTCVIEHLNPRLGSTMSSIREVARLAGVSVATVSRALSTPEKVSSESIRKVQAAIEKVQYRPNMLARNFR